MNDGSYNVPMPERYQLRSPMPACAAEAYAWHARPAAFLRLQPPWEVFRDLSQDGSFAAGKLDVRFRAKCIGPLTRKWHVEFLDFAANREFKYRQVRGPFAEWTHTHRFIPDTETTSFLENTVEYRLPFGPLGHAFGAGMVDDRIRAMFSYRHALLVSDLRRHGLYRDRPRLTIALTGSRGLIGSELAAFLATGGHRVRRLVTGSSAKPHFDDGTEWLSWNPVAPVDPAALDGCDAVIHLAADGISEGRWNDRKRKKILESRTIPTRHMADAITALPPSRRPKVFLCASAVGIYGDRGDEVLAETASAGSGFLADVCKEWEAAAAPAAVTGVRTVNLRIGAVLTPRDGALGKQLPAFRAGLGAVLGTGKQWVPWITVHDTVGAIHHCLMTDALCGPVNLMAPESVTNRTFTKTLGSVLWRPAFNWLPRPALKLMFGDIADAVLLSSMRGSPEKLLATGFKFDHAELESGLRFLLGETVPS
ncbi:MAG: TIGR01777 family oxidoreductase [Gemmataceae bacterium]